MGAVPVNLIQASLGIEVVVSDGRRLRNRHPVRWPTRSLKSALHSEGEKKGDNEVGQ